MKMMLELYADEHIQVHLEPLALWCDANYIEKRVDRIDANTNTIHLEESDPQ